MNKYEISVIFKPGMEEEVLKAELEKVLALFTRFGGTVEKIDEWGKRRLAYEIQKLTEGVYYFITLEAPADAPSEIEERLRIMESVIRYLIIRLDA